MSTVEELREERQRLEALQDRIRTIDSAVEVARRAEESAARAERRERQALRQAVIDRQSEFGADLTDAFQQLRAFSAARDKLVQSRRDAITAERSARAAGISLDHSYLDFENGFLSSPEWRRLHDEVRLIFGSGKILG